LFFSFKNFLATSIVGPATRSPKRINGFDIALAANAVTPIPVVTPPTTPFILEAVFLLLYFETSS
jgi:hypothetical protein